MADLDSLSIQITASTKSAVDNINKLSDAVREAAKSSEGAASAIGEVSGSIRKLAGDSQYSQTAIKNRELISLFLRRLWTAHTAKQECSRCRERFSFPFAV